MITMTAEIEIFQGESFDNVNISITDSNGSNVQSNISANISNIFSKIKPKFSKRNPFIIGSSVLSGGATFSNGEQYFITNCFSSATKDENSNIYPFENDIIITMESIDYVLGVLPTVFSILFDVSDNVYPPQIIINGYNDLDVKQWTNTYLPETPYFTVANLDNSNCVRYEIIINGLNKPNSQLILLGVYSQLSIYADKRNLISLDSDRKDRSDNGQPSFGVISNGGEISLLDQTGEIKTYAQLGLLTHNLPIKLYIEDTLSKKERQVFATMYSEKFNYDNINYQLNISLTDGLTKLQEGKDIIKNLSVHPIGVSSSLDRLYGYSFGELVSDLTNQIQNFNIDFEGDFFNRFRFEYPMLDYATPWQQFQKLCDITGSNLWLDSISNPKLISQFDEKTIANRPRIKITPNQIYGDAIVDYVKDNRQNGVKEEIISINFVQDDNETEEIDESIHQVLKTENIIEDTNKYPLKLTESTSIKSAVLVGIQYLPGFSYHMGQFKFEIETKTQHFVSDALPQIYEDTLQIIANITTSGTRVDIDKDVTAYFINEKVEIFNSAYFSQNLLKQEVEKIISPIYDFLDFRDTLPQIQQRLMRVGYIQYKIIVDSEGKQRLEGYITYLSNIQSYWASSQPSTSPPTSIPDDYNDALFKKASYSTMSAITISITQLEYETNTIKQSFGSSPYFSIDSNSLLQQTATVFSQSPDIASPLAFIGGGENNSNTNSISSMPLSEYIAIALIKEWEKGKETATITCSVGEYYNYTDSLDVLISTKIENKYIDAITGYKTIPMLFEVGDVVIPFILSPDGNEIPLSRYNDGYPKEYLITRIKHYYDGSCMQEMDLQEIIDSKALKSMPNSNNNSNDTPGGATPI